MGVRLKHYILRPPLRRQLTAIVASPLCLACTCFSASNGNAQITSLLSMKKGSFESDSHFDANAKGPAKYFKIGGVIQLRGSKGD